MECRSVLRNINEFEALGVVFKSYEGQRVRFRNWKIFVAGECRLASSAIEKIKRGISEGSKRFKDVRKMSTNSQQQI